MATSLETARNVTEPQPPADLETPYEVVDGQIVEKQKMTAYEVWLAKVLYDALNDHVRDREQGRVYQEMLFDLAPLTRQRRPDVAFVSYERWPKTKGIPRTNAWAVVPDLAVEIVSPSNSGDDIVAKTGDYFEAGVRLIWVVFPREAQVYVYRSPTRIDVLRRDAELSGDDVVPGLRLPLAELFADEEDAEG